MTYYHVMALMPATENHWVELKNPLRIDGRWRADNPSDACKMARGVFFASKGVYSMEQIAIPQHRYNRYHANNGLNRPDFARA